MSKSSCLLGFLLFLSANIYAAQLPPGFAEELVLEGLNPVAMTIDHHGRVWVVQKHGEILIVEDGELLPDPFIVLDVDDFNERGLLGIALHPDFDNNPYVYLYYTVPEDDHNRLSRFTANGDLAVPGSEEILLDLDPLTGTIHNGGSLFFGIDGMLYVATGDGAQAANAQDLTNLLGKILRLEPDGDIPPDNPFYNQLTGNNRAIYAYGLRNPFSVAYNPATDDILAGDVGNADFEEVNRIVAGGNYGWPLVEGLLGGQDPPTNYQDPLFAYPHTDGCAIVGAGFYRPDLVQFPPEYFGKFFYSDYCEGYINILDPETGELIGPFATNVDRPLSIVVDPQSGDMYYLARAGLGGGSTGDNTSTNEGTLWRVFYTGNGAPYIAVHPHDVFLPEGENAAFFVQASGSAPLSYQWQINGADVPNADSSHFTYSAVPLSADGSEVRCVVSNGEGTVISEVAILSVTDNTRPEPEIALPVEGAFFRAGEEIGFSGSATDTEDGNLAASQLTWEVIWHHNEHTHPGVGPLAGVSEGSWTVPTVGETSTNVWYRIYLTAEDLEGLTETTFVEIFPELADLQVNGPTNLEINLDGQIRPLPHTFQSLIGLQRVFQAPASAVVGDSLYLFQEWEDGSTDLIRTVIAPENGATYEAIYEAIPLGTGIGLYGEYFDDPELDLSGLPDLTRIDSVIQFQWADGGPGGNIPEDYFTVRWTGEVEPIFTEEYTFHVISDDGVRLWVNDSLIIDWWVPQGPTERTGSISLQAGSRYPIRLEYHEIGGGAEVSMYWSSSSTAQEIVPQSQLYPVEAGVISGNVYLDENGNGQIDPADPPMPNTTVLVFEAANNSPLLFGSTDEEGAFSFSGIPAGMYYLWFLPDPEFGSLEGGVGINSTGYTLDFELDGGTQEEIYVSFFLVSTSVNHLPVVLGNLQIAPNPASEEVTINWEPDYTDPLAFTLFDVRGQVLYQQNPTQSGQLQIPLQGLASGTYLLRAEAEGQAVFFRLIKI